MQDDNIQSLEPKKSSKAMKWTLVILLVVVVGVVGYFGYTKYKQQNNQLAEKQSQIANLQADKAKLEADKKAAEEATSADNDYFVIKEWGVKFKSGSLTDLAYAMKDNKYAYFSTNSIMSSDISSRRQDINSVNCSPLGTSMAILARGKKGESINGQPDPVFNYDQVKGAIKVGDYYYVISHAQAACSEDKKTQDMVEAQYKQLAEAIKTLQATK